MRCLLFCVPLCFFLLLFFFFLFSIVAEPSLECMPSKVWSVLGSYLSIADVRSCYLTCRSVRDRLQHKISYSNCLKISSIEEFYVAKDCLQDLVRVEIDFRGLRSNLISVNLLGDIFKWLGFYEVYMSLKHVSLRCNSLDNVTSRQFHDVLSNFYLPPYIESFEINIAGFPSLELEGYGCF